MLPISPDFVKLAEAFGIKGLAANTPDEMEEVIKEGLSHKGPVIMDFKCRTEELVYPMVPAGKAIHEMLLGSPNNNKDQK
jgi:acetolactate synthase-1/2/3 large subunit